MQVDFQIEEFVRFQKSRESKVWDFGNDILYKLCKDYSRHNEECVVIAKLWLIGRSYAAAVERRREKHESSDEFYIKVAKKLLNSKLDQQIARLQRESMLNKKNIKILIDVHFHLTKLFYTLTDLNKIALASKYLHFHRPIVPIYDSRAQKGISKLVKGSFRKKYVVQFLLDKNCSYPDYTRLVLRMYHVQKFLREKTGRIFSVRDIDKYLLKLTEDKTCAASWNCTKKCRRRTWQRRNGAK